MFASMDRDSTKLVESIVSLVYFMRGAVSYHDMWWMTHSEREIIKSFLDSRFESESKNQHPVY